MLMELKPKTTDNVNYMYKKCTNHTKRLSTMNSYRINTTYTSYIMHTRYMKFRSGLCKPKSETISNTPNPDVSGHLNLVGMNNINHG